MEQRTHLAVRAGLRAGCKLHIAPGWETDSKLKCSRLCFDDNVCRSMGDDRNYNDLSFDEKVAFLDNIETCNQYWCNGLPKK